MQLRNGETALISYISRIYYALHFSFNTLIIYNFADTCWIKIKIIHYALYEDCKLLSPRSTSHLLELFLLTLVKVLTSYYLLVADLLQHGRSSAN